MVFYLLQSVLLQFLTDSAYEKYIRFYLGLVFILMVLTPFVDRSLMTNLLEEFAEILASG